MKNSVIKNEKWIVFPESRYVNANPDIFNHPMIYKICDAMMSISTWDMVHFLTISFEPQLIKSPNVANW